MNTVIQLERMGYTFTIEGEKIRYFYTGDSPDPAIVRPLLAELSQRRNEAIQFLQERTDRWVYPEIYRHFASMPPEGWPLDLYRPDPSTNSGYTQVWFNSPAELLAATMPPCPECGEMLAKSAAV